MLKCDCPISYHNHRMPAVAAKGFSLPTFTPANPLDKQDNECPQDRDCRVLVIIASEQLGTVIPKYNCSQLTSIIQGSTYLNTLLTCISIPQRTRRPRFHGRNWTKPVPYMNLSFATGCMVHLSQVRPLTRRRCRPLSSG
jgi:hypothetical protein